METMALKKLLRHIAMAGSVLVATSHIFGSSLRGTSNASAMASEWKTLNVVSRLAAATDGRIAYTYTSNGGGDFQIRARNADGSNETVIANTGICREASFSSDGSRVVYTTNRNGIFNVWISDGDGANARQLTNFSSNAVQPEISGDGSTIVFISSSVTADVYSIQSDGTGLMRLTNDNSVDEFPSINRDGSVIVWMSQRDGNREIYRMNGDGSQPTRLTNNSVDDSEPDVSRDGQRVVFQTNRNGNNDVYSMDITGNGLLRLTSSPKPEEQPTWSPNGSFIAYAVDEGSLNNEIYVMNADGSESVNITSSGTFEAQPTWGGGTQVVPTPAPTPVVTPISTATPTPTVAPTPTPTVAPTPTTDVAAPVINFTVPQDNAALNDLLTLRGTVRDDVSGIDAVILQLRRLSDGFYWNGTTWKRNSFDLNATFEGSDMRRLTWQRRMGLPSGASLAEATYRVVAIAIDRAGRRGVAAVTFMIDRTVPSPPAIQVPILNGQYQSILGASGIAADNRGGSGIGKVLFYLRRAVDGRYWTGTIWSSNSVALPASLTPQSVGSPPIAGVRWSSGRQWPAPSQFQTGRYWLQLLAIDRAGNRSASNSGFDIDRLSPIVQITQPSRNSSLFNLSVVSGVASDNSRRVARVILYLRRQSDGAHWNGALWVRGTAPLTTVLSGTTWKRAGGWPIAGTLQPGNYTLLAFAFDGAGNVGSDAIVVTIQPSTTTAGARDAANDETKNDGKT